MIRIRAARIGFWMATAALLPGAIAGCAIRPVPAPTPQQPPPVIALPPSRTGPLLAHFKTTVHGPAGKRTFRQIVAVVPPDRIRLEVFGPFGHLRLIVAMHEEGTVGLFPRDGLYFLEPDSGAVLQALLGADLDARAMVPILTGDVLSRDDGTRFGIPRWDREGWRLDAVRVDSGLHYDLLLDPRTLRIVEAGLTPGAGTGEPVVRVRYGRWKFRNGRHLATRLEVEVPESAIRVVSLLQKEESEGADFPDRLFRPAIPPGFRRIAVEDLAADTPWLARPG